VAGYTYSHALDNASASEGAVLPLDSTRPALQYASSDFDIRHRFTFSLTYAIPGKKMWGQFLEGWHVNSIVTLQTGQPWGTGDTANDFSGTGRSITRTPLLKGGIFLEIPRTLLPIEPQFPTLAEPAILHAPPRPKLLTAATR
jgi:hypothetical protein